MLTYSKFFTPAFTRQDRLRLLEALGFSHFTYRFLESRGEQVLRDQTICGPGVSHHLGLEAADQADFPILKWNHPTSDLPLLSPSGEASLWEEIFPNPLRLFGCRREASAVSVAPATFMESLGAFRSAIARLEDHMVGTELFCLWVAGETIDFPVLFHLVRRKRVRIGTAPYLHALGEELRQGNLTSARLRDYFGTSAGFLYLDTKSLGAKWSLPLLSASLEKALGPPKPAPQEDGLSHPHPEIGL